jgi:hypothetical protein
LTFAARGDTPRTPPFFFYFIFLIIQDAENAKGRWIFLSVDPLESEADMKVRKKKI